MKVIVCVDNNNGILFNNRRVSSDKFIIDDIYSYTSIINISSYSEDLFIDRNYNICDKLEKGYNFIEGMDISNYIEEIDEVVVYSFNRDYPSDNKFDIDLSRYNLIHINEFKGNSHDSITRTTYKVFLI